MSAEAGSDIDEAAIRAALAELTAWDLLRRSPQLSAFLTYVVEAVLRGEGASVKAYAIAVDVFGRGENFDPQSDPIVRVQARRLRALLKDFDARGLGTAPVRILIPVGRYIPEILPRESGTPAPNAFEDDEISPGAGGESGRAPPSRSILIAGIVGIGLLAVALVFWPVLGERTGLGTGPAQPRMPLVLVEDFENLTDDQRGVPLAAGLAVELVAMLDGFPDLSARYAGARAAPEAVDHTAHGAVYLASGVVRRVGGGVVYSLLVQDADTRVAVADLEVRVPVDDGVPTMDLRAVSERFALHLGNPRGIVHSGTRAWLSSEAAMDIALDPYPCLAAFAAFRAERSEIVPPRLEACMREGARAGRPEAMAGLGFILAIEGWRAGRDTEAGAALLAEAMDLSRGAMEAAPLSGFIWAQLGAVNFLAGQRGPARDAFNTAIQINPAMADTLADYAYAEALAGNWAAANALSERAFSAEEVPPPAFYSVPALRALRDRDYDRAVIDGMRMIEAFPDLGAALVVAAGGHLRNGSMVNRYLPRLLASQRFRRLGIMPALRQYVADPDLLRELGSGILHAGVSLDRLAEPF